MQNPKNIKRLLLIAFLLLIVVVIASSCADVSHVEKCLPVEEHTYGFWGGLWHGIISPLAFIGSLLSDNIDVYAKNNNGGWYDFGFLLGVGAFSSTTTVSCTK